MSLNQHLRKAWASHDRTIWQSRMIGWRKDQSTIRIEHPTRLDRARALGYKAKPGIIVVRTRVKRGGKMRPQIRAGRRSKHMRRKFILSKSYQSMAEMRANRKYPNLEVLNSYFVAEDGIHSWYEIILLDPANPAIQSDSHYNWVARGANKRRAFRGLTMAGRRSRGLLNKGRGAEKIRPSLRAHGRRGTA
ncbi:MAG: 50S ribosomal protein L15e [Nanoarchaeota archaeon]|nr:MAG: 50S ribosomal protein L15e [Nanoarchaeota archaeon]